jgi:hypothetical protein
LRRVTIPLIGDSMRTLLKSNLALSAVALSDSIRSCWVRNCVSWERKSDCRNFSSFSERSSASRVVSPPFHRFCCRLWFSSACFSATFELSIATLNWSTCDRAAASEASVRCTADRRLRGSIWSRNCPLSTLSPSSTARSVTRPIVSALMLTSRFG